MNIVRQVLLISAVLFAMVAIMPNTANAAWTATLVWSKVVVAGGGLSYSDEGLHRSYYDGHSLTRIEFYDWNGDATGASIDFTGRTSLKRFGESGNYLGATTWDSAGVVERFATYDRTGSTVLEWTEHDSLNPSSSFMVYGTGRVLRGRLIVDPHENLTVYEPNGTPIFTVTLDSTCIAWLSNDGQRLYVPVGCASPWIPSPERDEPALRVYDVDTGTLMYTLPRAPYQYRARDVDVIALWDDQVLTVYLGGVSQGSPGNVGAIGLSPNGQYLVGLTAAPTHTVAYAIGTMTQLWSIADTTDAGEQLPTPLIGDNGVAIYKRIPSGGGRGITVVAPTGTVIFEQDYPAGARGDLSGDGSFFTIERYDDHVVSYYSVTEE